MKYTVVLIRPDYLADDYGKDIYVASVDAATPVAALKAAQTEVYKADKRDGRKASSADDYALTVMFEEHPKIALFGWQS